MKKTLILSLVALLIIGLIVLFLQNQNQPSAVSQQAPADPKAIIAVKLPKKISNKGLVGKQKFETKCASCHGLNGAGQKNVAPPLIHKIYEPSHHNDEAFQRAAAFGVPAHHWPFGNMKPVDGVTRSDVANIITYIREIQRANGIR